MTVIIYLLALYSLIHSFNAFYTAKPQSSLNRKINIQKYNNNNIKYDRTINNPSSSSKLVLSMTNNNKNDDEDDEDREFLGRIKTSYLVNKFKDCRGEDCRAFCSRDEIQALLTCILPPVTPADLTMETNRIIATFSQPDLISADDFVLAASENSFWQRAGSLVVKELIFLDCLNSYYYDKQNMLDNEVLILYYYYCIQFHIYFDILITIHFRTITS